MFLSIVKHIARLARAGFQSVYVTQGGFRCDYYSLLVDDCHVSPMVYYLDISGYDHNNKTQTITITVSEETYNQ